MKTICPTSHKLLFFRFFLILCLVSCKKNDDVGVVEILPVTGNTVVKPFQIVAFEIKNPSAQIQVDAEMSGKQLKLLKDGNIFTFIVPALAAGKHALKFTLGTQPYLINYSVQTATTTTIGQAKENLQTRLEVDLKYANHVDSLRKSDHDYSYSITDEAFESYRQALLNYSNELAKITDEEKLNLARFIDANPDLFNSHFTPNGRILANSTPEELAEMRLNTLLEQNKKSVAMKMGLGAFFAGWKATGVGVAFAIWAASGGGLVFGFGIAVAALCIVKAAELAISSTIASTQANLDILFRDPDSPIEVSTIQNTYQEHLLSKGEKNKISLKSRYVNLKKIKGGVSKVADNIAANCNELHSWWTEMKTYFPDLSQPVRSTNSLSSTSEVKTTSVKYVTVKESKLVNAIIAGEYLEIDVPFDFSVNKIIVQVAYKANNAEPEQLQSLQLDVQSFWFDLIPHTPVCVEVPCGDGGLKPEVRANMILYSSNDLYKITIYRDGKVVKQLDSKTLTWTRLGTKSWSTTLTMFADNSCGWTETLQHGMPPIITPWPVKARKSGVMKVEITAPPGITPLETKSINYDYYLRGL